MSDLSGPDTIDIRSPILSLQIPTDHRTAPPFSHAWIPSNKTPAILRPHPRHGQRAVVSPQLFGAGAPDTYEALMFKTASLPSL